MDKKKQILESALRLFVECGFHNTPTSKIAKEAGVATGTLFYFYATKDELVKALYLDAKYQLSEQISAVIKNETTLKGILKGYYSTTLQWTAAHKTEFRFIEQFNSSPYLNQIATEDIEKHITPIVAILKKGMSEHIIKQIDVDLLISLISGHTFSMNQYLATQQLADGRQVEIINQTFDLLWDMMTE